MRTPILSIITPCYNHGIYLDEMMESVQGHHWTIPIEHIIVNDGSNDEYTLRKISELRKKNSVTVIDQDNQGLASARNNAIAAASGKFFLPLDSDNKINAAVIEGCLMEMMKDEKIDAVYTDVMFFGEQNGLRKVGKFDLARLLIEGNYIDACAIFKRKLVQDLGGYDDKMPAMGHEDWDLWVRLGVIQANCEYREQTGFFYRVNSNSMVNTLTNRRGTENHEYIIKKNMHVFMKLSLKNQLDLRHLRGQLRHQRLKSIVKLIIGKYSLLGM